MNTHDSGLAHGTSGSPQTTIDNSALEQKVNELKVTPKYVPTKKHDVGGFGSPNPVKTQKEGQKLLDTGYKDGKQIYNITDNGDIVKF